MRDQRWPGDYQTIGEQMRTSRAQEQMGMAGANESHENDYLAMGMTQKLDYDQKCQLDPSWCTQLDTVGMQPHAREYLERDVNAMRGARKFEMISGQMIDYPEGIHFGDTP